MALNRQFEPEVEEVLKALQKQIAALIERVAALETKSASKPAETQTQG